MPWYIVVKPKQANRDILFKQVNQYSGARFFISKRLTVQNKSAILRTSKQGSTKLGYTVENESIQRIAPRNGVATVFAPTVGTLIVDPCDLGSGRYTFCVDGNAFFSEIFSWYEIILGEDTEHTRRVKVEHYQAVIDAEKAIETAHEALRKLRGW